MGSFLFRIILYMVRATVFRMFLRAGTSPKIPRGLRFFAMAVALIYLLMPKDILPDFGLPFPVGFMDDVLIVGIIVFIFVTRLLPRLGSSQSNGGRKSDRTTIDGEYEVLDDEADHEKSEE
jgi:uncharacterized membrane protein YkvA (DUF1232 family)